MAANPNTVEFPSQKKATSQKSRDWCIKCIDGAEQLAMHSDEGIRASKENKQINYNLYADILDESDVQRVLNPYNISGVNQGTSPAKMQNYPVSNPKIELLIGEESKRRLDYKILAVNADAISEKEKMIKQRIMDFLAEQLTADTFDKEQAQLKLRELDKWRKFEAQDIRERMASQVLEYYVRKLRMSDKFNEGFLDALLAAEEIYCVDILAGEPEVRRVNPMNLYTVRSGSSPFIEDSDIIVEENYFPLGKVIDMYYDELSSTDIRKLENREEDATEGEGLLRYSTGGFGTPPAMFYNPDNDGLLIEVNDKTYGSDHAAYDDDGNVRVLRVVWKSMRKIGIIEYEEDGSTFRKLVDENYRQTEEELTTGQKIKWVWVSEWWEGTRLGKDIYIKMGPRPIQFRGMTNLSNCGSGYVGTVYNSINSVGRSLMDRIKPYQYLYNVFMYRTELAFAKAKGRIGKMNLAKIPDGWDIDKWLYYAEQMGWAVEDPFKSGTEGVATGKLAGNMNEGSVSIDLEMGNYIQQHIMMLNFIEQQIGQIAGVTKQREGMVDNRETVGGVERAVLQSATITEPWFRVHDATKLRVLEVLLETAKYTLRKDKAKMQYVLDDLSGVLFEIDGEQLNEAEYGLFMTDASADKELHQALKQLAQAAMQNDRVTLSGIIDIYTTTSTSALSAKLRTMEEDFHNRMMEQQKAQNEAAMQQLQAQKEARMQELVMQHEHEYALKLLELQMKDTESTQDPAKLEDLRLKREKMIQDHTDRMRELEEVIRSNKVDEQLKAKAIEVSAKKAAKPASSSK